MPSGKPLTIAVLLLGTAFVLQFPPVAQETQAAGAWNNPWTREIVGATTTPDTILLGHWGRTEAVTWITTGGSHWSFATRNANTAAWTVRTTSVDGATFTVPCPFDLVGFGAGKWAMVGAEACGAGARIFTSTDNGTTWTLNTGYQWSLGMGQGNAVDLANNLIDGTLLVYSRTSTTNLAQVRISTDGGATWGTAIDIGNNDGSPTETSTTRAVSCTAAACSYSLDALGPNVYASIPDSTTISSVTGRMYTLDSADSGAYWTTPYTTHLGTTLRPYLQGGPAYWQNNKYFADGVAYGESSASKWSTTFLSGTTVDMTCYAGTVAYPNGQQRAPIATAHYNFMYFGVNRCTGAQNTTLAYSNGGPWYPSYVLGPETATTKYNVDVSDDRSYFAYQNVVFGGRLEVYTQETPSKVPSPPSVVISVTGGLVGFKVDGVGQNAIARFEDHTVRSYAAYNLVQTNSQATPDCTRVDGVDALYTVAGSYLVYADCYSDGSVYKIRIRDGALGGPNYPSSCSSECQDPQEAHSLLADIDVPGELDDMGSISARPYFFKRNTLPGWVLTNNACASFAYSTYNGKVGVFEPCYVNNGFDKSQTATRALNDGSLPVSDFCTWIHDGRDYMAGVAITGSTGAFEVSFQNAGAPFNDYLQKPVISPVFVNGAGYGGAKTLACADDTIWFGKDSFLYRMRVVGGIVELAKKDVGGPISYHGLAVSGDGNWLAYSRSDHTYILNAKTLVQVRDIQNPGTNLQRVELDQLGQVVWIATYTKIARQEIWPETTGVPKNNIVDDFGNPLPGAGNETVPPDDNGNCPAGYVKIRVNGTWVCQLDPTGGINPPTGGGIDLISPVTDGLKELFGEWGPWILALLLIFGLGGTGFYLWGKGMAVLLGLLGYSMSIVAGIIPIWNLAVFVLLCAAAFVLKQRIWSLS
jgi:hypothetical protein